MNFVIDLAQRGSSSVVEHRGAESEDLRFDSSWELSIVSSSRALDKTKKHLSLPYSCSDSPSRLYNLSLLRLG